MRRDVLYMLRPLNVFQPLRQCRANAIDIIFENVLIFLRYRDKTGIVSYDPADCRRQKATRAFLRLMEDECQITGSTCSIKR